MTASMFLWSGWIPNLTNIMWMHLSLCVTQEALDAMLQFDDFEFLNDLW